MTRFIDVNADLGESAERWASGEDVALLDAVTSANVCTGAYAGDDDLIQATCAAAAERGIAVGAQVGYPDRAAFGRRPMEFTRAGLSIELGRQLAHLGRLARAAGAQITYVKPHGALYHRVLQDPDQRSALECAAGHLPVLGLAGAGFSWSEGFADRGYQKDGTLIPRGEEGAIITDPDAAAEQAVQLMSKGVDSICVHSDSPAAAAIAAAVRKALESAGAEVRHR